MDCLPGEPENQDYHRNNASALIRMAGGSISSGLFCMLDTMTVAFQNGGDGSCATFVKAKGKT